MNDSSVIHTTISPSGVTINSTVQFSAWQERWETTQRTYEALVSEHKVDDAYTFFENCMMLKYAIKYSPEFKKGKITVLFNAHWEMRLCRDIHERKARFIAAPDYLGIYFTHIADRCMDRWSDFLKTALRKNRKVA